MSKRRKKVDSTTAKIAEAFELLERVVRILGELGREIIESESTPSERLSKRAYENAKRLYPDPKKSKKSKKSGKKSKGKSGNT